VDEHEELHIFQAGQSPIRVVGGSIELYAKYGWQLVDSKCDQTGSVNACSYWSSYFTQLGHKPSKIHFDDFTHPEKHHNVGDKKWQVDVYPQAKDGSDNATSPAVTICSTDQKGDKSQCSDGTDVLLMVAQQTTPPTYGFYSVTKGQTPPLLLFRYKDCNPSPSDHREDLGHVVISIDGAPLPPGQCPKGICAVGAE
jgi:hypothetical protein